MPQALITGTPDFCRCPCPDVVIINEGGGTGGTGTNFGGAGDPPPFQLDGSAWPDFATWQDTSDTSRTWWYSVDFAGWVPRSV